MFFSSLCPTSFLAHGSFLRKVPPTPLSSPDTTHLTHALLPGLWPPFPILLSAPSSLQRVPHFSLPEALPEPPVSPPGLACPEERGGPAPLTRSHISLPLPSQSCAVGGSDYQPYFADDNLEVTFPVRHSKN